MAETQAEPGELWLGPFPMLDLGPHDCCLVERGVPYNGPGLYAVAFADGVEAVCRIERTHSGDVTEIEADALRIVGRVEWIFRPAPNERAEIPGEN